MHISLVGKKVLVGGATQGLGKAIAWQMAESGAHVTLVARNQEKLTTLCSQLPNNGEQIHQYVQVDFLNFSEYQLIMTDYFKKNTVDILINNTQGPSAGNWQKQDSQTYQQAFDLLFQTVVFTTTLALSHMRAMQFGRIINVSSITTRQPLAHLILSNSIRSAVVGWAKTLTAEVAAQNITVNNLLTGFFDTERLAEIIAMQAAEKQVSTKEWRTTVEQSIPMQRLGCPAEFGYLAAFLASDKAAYITGASIPIDGGLLKSI